MFLFYRPLCDMVEELFFQFNEIKPIHRNMLHTRNIWNECRSSDASIPHLCH